jgi:hypothetical protein
LKELNADLNQLKASSKPNELFSNTWSVQKNIDEITGKLASIRREIENLRRCSKA